MDRPPSDVKPGDVVQLHPELTANPAFAGCLLVVTEAKPWGVQGYVELCAPTGEKGQAYYRAAHGTFEPTGGVAVWMAI